MLLVTSCTCFYVSGCYCLALVLTFRCYFCDYCLRILCPHSGRLCFLYCQFASQLFFQSIYYFKKEVTSLWRHVLSRCVMHEHECWLLRFKCLEGFESFSRVTKHPEIVQRICSNDSDPQIRDMVKSHLKRVISLHFVSSFGDQSFQ